MRAPGYISGGAPNGTPTCQTCAFQKGDGAHPGWGWCKHPQNRTYSEGWPLGFTPSQSPSGSCSLHPERAALLDSASPAQCQKEDA